MKDAKVRNLIREVMKYMQIENESCKLSVN